MKEMVKETTETSAKNLKTRREKMIKEINETFDKMTDLIEKKSKASEKV